MDKITALLLAAFLLPTADAGDWPCRADAERLCGGEADKGACLMRRWDELSGECRAFKERMREQWRSRNAKPAHEPCLADKERLCPGSERPGMCLEEKFDRLSPACKAYKEEARRRWASPRKGEGPEACREDMQRLCAGAERPGACLEERLDQLSPACREFKLRFKALAGKPSKPLLPPKK